MPTPSLSPPSFAERFLTRRDALVERSGNDLFAILAGEFRSRYGLPEDVVMAQEAGAEFSIGYGSELLQAFIRDAIGGGRIAAVEVASHARPTPQPYSGINVAIDAEPEGPATATLLAGTFRVVADCDEQRQYRIGAAVTVPTGAPLPCPKFDPTLLRETAAGGGEELLRCLDRLSLEASLQTVELVTPFRHMAKRRMARDMARIAQYFNDLELDIKKRLARRPTSSLQTKLESLASERDRRFEQLAHTYRMNVSLAPVALYLLKSPSQRVRLQAKRRKRRLDISVRWFPACRLWEPLRCESCGRGIHAFALCEQAKHLFCGTCYDKSGTGGRRPCFRCDGTKPPVGTRIDRGIAIREGHPSAHDPGLSGGGLPPAPNTVGGIRDAILATLGREAAPQSARDLREALGLSSAALTKALKTLVKNGLVERTGRGTGTRYALPQGPGKTSREFT